MNHLTDAIAAEPNNVDLNDIGQRVILPSSYMGGPQHMNQCYQDSMSLGRRYRKVDVFLTMTTNPYWDEITQELEPGQTPYDRPDLIARVFEMKRKALLDEIYNHGIFGLSVAYIYTIEFQKHGLPHMHLLIFLHVPHKLTTPEAVDSCIWARWPDPEQYPKLFATVKWCMVHTCSATSCLANGKCSKGFPKAFNRATTMDTDGYPDYWRPDNGSAYEISGTLCDNCHIVPYNPYLSAKYDCHLNMECAASFATLKYIFKYVQKGPDRGLLEFQMKDEVKRWIDGRYISSPDAMWRIFQFDTHQQTPNVVWLQVHLPEHQFITFNPNEDAEMVLDCASNQSTTLTAFFEANRDQGDLGTTARKYTYQEFPQHFVYDKNARKWKLRK